MSKDKDFKVVESKWIGRSLSNYKSMHAKRAESLGKGKAFHNARTLTEARKIIFGVKRGQDALKR